MQKKVKISIALVVVLAVVGAVAYNAFNANSSLQSYDNQPVSQAQLSALNAIANNVSLANRIGSGVIVSFPSSINATPLVQGGKPTVLYIGGEFCPFCAATRWALIIALDRFGSFSGLKYMTSSTADVYASTPTFTFHNSSYTSQYINFIPVETENNTDAPLQQPTAWENTTFTKFDPPTSSCTSGGCIPFIDFVNASVQVGAPFSPGVIWSNHYNWNQIIAELNNTNSSVSQSIIGSADIFTAGICKADNMQPSSVCSQSYVTKILSGM